MQGPTPAHTGRSGLPPLFVLAYMRSFLCNYVGRLAVGSQPHLNQLRIFSSDSVVADYMITTMIVISLLVEMVFVIVLSFSIGYTMQINFLHH